MGTIAADTKQYFNNTAFKLFLDIEVVSTTHTFWFFSSRLSPKCLSMPLTNNVYYASAHKHAERLAEARGVRGRREAWVASLKNFF